MAGLVPAIHVFPFDGDRQDVDARDKRRHDGLCVLGLLHASHAEGYAFCHARRFVNHSLTPIVQMHLNCALRAALRAPLIWRKASPPLFR
jgi:hypothetical protein